MAAGIRNAYAPDAIEPDLSLSMANASQPLDRVGERIAEHELT
jgi:hypothetical protein